MKWTVSEAKAYVRYVWGPWEILHWRDDGAVRLWIGYGKQQRIGEEWPTVHQAKSEAKRLTAHFERFFGLKD